MGALLLLSGRETSPGYQGTGDFHKEKTGLLRRVRQGEEAQPPGFMPERRFLIRMFWTSFLKVFSPLIKFGLSPGTGPSLWRYSTRAIFACGRSCGPSYRGEDFTTLKRIFEVKQVMKSETPTLFSGPAPRIFSLPPGLSFLEHVVRGVQQSFQFQKHYHQPQIF